MSHIIAQTLIGVKGQMRVVARGRPPHPRPCAWSVTRRQFMILGQSESRALAARPRQVAPTVPMTRVSTRVSFRLPSAASGARRSAYHAGSHRRPTSDFAESPPVHNLPVRRHAGCARSGRHTESPAAAPPAYRRQSSSNARVISDRKLIVKRDIKIDTHEDFFFFNIDIAEI